MPVWELSTATFAEVGRRDRRRSVAVLPTGAIEAHGPHLPLTTDVIIAEAMARAGAERLSGQGMDVVLLPALPYAPAPFAAAFHGTISVRPETVSVLIADIARSLASHGFGALAIANAHLDPAHLAALHAAVEAVRVEADMPVAFPDLTRRPWGARLTDEFRSGACHAGRFETSIVLACRPDLVHDRIRATLPEQPRSLSAAIRAGKRTFGEAGGPDAYFGDPAAATAEEGRATIDALGGILADAVTEALAPPGIRAGEAS